MMRSGFKMTTMLFVLILSLMTAFCSAKNNKQSDTKVNYIHVYGHYTFFNTVDVNSWRN